MNCGVRSPRNRSSHSSIQLRRGQNSESYPRVVKGAGPLRGWLWAALGPPTYTGLLVGPVLAVVLAVAPPPAGDAAAVLTPELEVAGAVGGFGGVFWGKTQHQLWAPPSVNVKLQCTHSLLHTESQGSRLPPGGSGSLWDPAVTHSVRACLPGPTRVSRTHTSMDLANDTECSIFTLYQRHGLAPANSGNSGAIPLASTTCRSRGEPPPQHLPRNASLPRYTERQVPDSVKWNKPPLALLGVGASLHSVSYMETQELAGNTAKGGGSEGGVQGR